ncbi:MAG: RluA family pseudouridine synthase [Candidatus Yonathbacteria bacterium]|nr:RluA family pseudouridine synthase [Candidatus Yonathbacteria bacterium]
MTNEPTILFETEELLAIDKPAGLLVHGDGKEGRAEETLVDWLLARYPYIADVGESWEAPDGTTVPRPGIVHRLDRDTSGVLLIAKTEPMYRYLKRQFQERKVRKEYRALVYGTIKDDRGSFHWKIGRERGGVQKRATGTLARGEMREAQTDFAVIDRKGGFTYVALFPHTGRTHQIRVHLQAAQRPIVCDSLYASPRLRNETREEDGSGALGMRRLALHAYRITLRLPGGEEKLIEAPMPPDMTAALARFAKL